MVSSPSLWWEYIASIANGNPGKGLATFHAELHKNPYSNDVRPVVELLRHALFHGAVTPIGWKLGHTQESLAWLEGFSQVTLRQDDQAFSDWFKLQTKN